MAQICCETNLAAAEREMGMMLFIVQLLLLVVIMFGDIGFDRPGRFGMSFWHGVVLISLYVIAVLTGLF